MAVYNMPSSKDMSGGMQALSDVFNAFGRYERERQDMQMRDALIKKATSPLTPEEEADPNLRWQNIVSEISGFKPQYGGGVQGAVQKFGGLFAGPSQVGQSMQDMTLAGMTPDATVNRQYKQAQIDKTESGTGEMAKLNQALSMASQYTKLAEQESVWGDEATAAQYRKAAAHWAQMADKLGGSMFGTGEQARTIAPKQIETVNLNTGAHKLNGAPTGQVTPVPQGAQPAADQTFVPPSTVNPANGPGLVSRALSAVSQHMPPQFPAIPQGNMPQTPQGTNPANSPGFGSGARTAGRMAAQMGIAPQQAAAATQPAVVKNDADYEALPSGTLFTAPDGILRRKP